MNLKEIINLPVYTQSKKYLGRIIDLEMNCETGKIEQYFVKTGLLSNLFQQSLVINNSQVICLSKKEMIVKDNFKEVKDFVSSPA